MYTHTRAPPPLPQRHTTTTTTTATTSDRVPYQYPRAQVCVNEWFHTSPHRDILHPKIRKQLRPVWPAAAWRTEVAMAMVMAITMAMAKANGETDDTWTLAPAFGGQMHLSTGHYDLRAVVATPLESQTYIPESAGGSMNIFSSTTHAHSTTFPPNAWITEMPVNKFIHNPVRRSACRCAGRCVHSI